MPHITSQVLFLPIINTFNSSKKYFEASQIASRFHATGTEHPQMGDVSECGRSLSFSFYRTDSPHRGLLKDRSSQTLHRSLCRWMVKVSLARSVFWMALILVALAWGWGLWGGILSILGWHGEPVNLSLTVIIRWLSSAEFNDENAAYPSSSKKLWFVAQ